MSAYGFEYTMQDYNNDNDPRDGDDMAVMETLVEIENEHLIELRGIASTAMQSEWVYGSHKAESIDDAEKWGGEMLRHNPDNLELWMTLSSDVDGAPAIALTGNGPNAENHAKYLATVQPKNVILLIDTLLAERKELAEVEDSYTTCVSMLADANAALEQAKLNYKGAREDAERIAKELETAKRAYSDLLQNSMAEARHAKTLTDELQGERSMMSKNAAKLEKELAAALKALNESNPIMRVVSEWDAYSDAWGMQSGDDELVNTVAKAAQWIKANGAP